MPSALIIGDAMCSWEDALAALALFKPDAVCATNNIGREWPGRLDYWCTLHIAKCIDWVGMHEAVRQRCLAGRNRPQTWAHKPGPGIDRVVGVEWAASTGGLCVSVMRREGFDRIVLAGVPMTAEGGHFYNGQPWKTAKNYQGGWKRRFPEISPFVRSMSGWTQELLGAPTPEWLANSANPGDSRLGEK